MHIHLPKGVFGVCAHPNKRTYAWTQTCGFLSRQMCKCTIYPGPYWCCIIFWVYRRWLSCRWIDSKEMCRFFFVCLFIWWFWHVFLQNDAAVFNGPFLMAKINPELNHRCWCTPSKLNMEPQNGHMECPNHLPPVLRFEIPFFQGVYINIYIYNYIYIHITILPIPPWYFPKTVLIINQQGHFQNGPFKSQNVCFLFQ